MKNKKFDLHQTITDKFIKALEEGVPAWQKTWKSESVTHTNLETKKAYTGINQLLLWMVADSMKFNSSVWATYNQVTNAGGTVIKGSKSTPVICNFVLYFDKNGKKIDTKKFSNAELEQMVKDGVAKKVWCERYVNVFNLEQTDLYVAEEKEAITVEPIEVCEDIINNMQNKPSIIREVNSTSAYYTPSQDKVVMPNIADFNSTESFYYTMFHELAHSTGHESRLNREGVSGEKAVAFGDETYSQEELVAELTASFVGAEAGILNDSIFNNSASYLQGWLKALKDDKKLIFKASLQASKATAYILNK